MTPGVTAVANIPRCSSAGGRDFLTPLEAGTQVTYPLGMAWFSARSAPLLQGNLGAHLRGHDGSKIGVRQLAPDPASDAGRGERYEVAALQGGRIDDNLFARGSELIEVAV